MVSITSEAPAARSRRRWVPALTLMVLAPLLAEVLPGATRFSAMFVFPIEMGMWGGGALMIRAAVRKWNLGWLNMLFLALGLALAEECVVQQTSLAPLVIQIKGQEYARAYGVNYVYFLWALIYETVFVVFLPVYLAELIFPDRRSETWLSRGGLVAVVVYFCIGALLAWFSWTHVARPQVFHVPVYIPPTSVMLSAIAVIGALVLAALGPLRDKLARVACTPLTPPPAWVVGVAGGLWATVLYCLVVLAFGIAPSFPPAIPVVTGLVLAVAAVVLVPRWAASPRWQTRYTYAIVFGTMLGSMLLSFAGFIGALQMDLWFKVIADAIAVILMVALGRRMRHRWNTPPN